MPHESTSPLRSTDPEPDGNRLLAALPAADRARLRPLLTAVSVETKENVWEANQPVRFVDFPKDAVYSILAVTSGGPLVEVGMIGNEGLVGLPVFLGADSVPGLAFAQVPGRAERMSADDFRRESAREGPLRDVLNRYTQGFMTQVSQSALCNRVHSAEQRLARWMLMVRDRVGRDEFPMTHEFMAQMLGVRRATVSEAAAALQKRGLIDYRRGTMTITDPPGFEAASCECYRIVRDHFDRLLGGWPR